MKPYCSPFKKVFKALGPFSTSSGMRRSARLQSLKRAREGGDAGNNKRARRCAPAENGKNEKGVTQKGQNVAKSRAKPTKKSTRKAKAKSAPGKVDKKKKKKSKAKFKIKRSLDDAPRDIELGLFQDGYKCVVGADEAGRGPLAGPVVAAACYVPNEFKGFAKTAKGENVVICGTEW